MLPHELPLRLSHDGSSPMPKKSTHRGFTLVELLVVIAIIGVLVALLLPAVQAAREAARRTQCLNHHKQLGLALHNYHDTHKILPPAIQFWNGDDSRTSDNMRPNWIIMILPFMEQQPLYDSFNFNVTISDPINRNSRGVRIQNLLCPSDPWNRTKFKGTSAAEGDNWQRGNYAASAHSDFSYENGWDNPLRRGVMGLNIGAKFSEITDGTSSVLMVGEVRAGLSNEDRRGTWAMGTAGASALFKHGCGGDANGPNAPWDSSDDIEGCDIITAANPGLSVLQKQKMTCWQPCPSMQATVRGLHPGGVTVCLADGSVHFIMDNVETSGSFGSCDPLAAWDKLICSGDGDNLPGGVIR